MHWGKPIRAFIWVAWTAFPTSTVHVPRGITIADAGTGDVTRENVERIRREE